MSSPTPLTTSHGLWAASGSQSLLRAIVLVLVGVAALTLTSKVQIPFYPVPMTLQTLALFGMAAAFGWRMAGATVLTWFAAGFAGLPVFSGLIAGPAYFVGPTAGYLAGFLVSAVVVGWLAEKGWDRSVWTTLLAMVIGNLIIYTLGYSWLAFLFNFSADADKVVPLTALLYGGVITFLWGDVLKIAVAALGLPLASKLVGRV